MQSTGQTSTQAESFVPMHGSVMTKGMSVSLYRNCPRLLDELDQVLRAAAHEEPSPASRDLVGPGAVLEPHDLRVPEAPVEDLDRFTPQRGIIEPRGEG